jgi:hypothetical protein
MRNKVLIVSFLLSTVVAISQESEPGGIWTAISADKDITKKWSVGGELEFRTKGFTTDRDRFAAQIGTDYQLMKNFKVGVSYNWLNVDDDYKFSSDSIRTDYFQNRHRLNTQAVWRFKTGNLTLQFRERFQATFKDDSDRINAKNEINNNRINPEFVWRNRIKMTYSRKKMPWSPYFSFETYYLLNEPEQVRFFSSDLTSFTERTHFFSKLRYSLGVDYKINKRHSVGVNGLFSHERGASEQAVPGPNYYAISPWTNDFGVGISYNIQL